ncbi:MAG: NAD(P)-dependent oxidoreductase [Kordiimonadaceae bacterium]|jgi:citronellol/citronellal dehydrogenase|nr:NAD(P)-dependent oxidoreductase [Kordiimonadaceae bacterium]MBT6036100.1 NAD(P)-dependent oxidoreductase [Kordiimonadaceae bacterium]MBT6328939.1 NAD(P)-dependent oxidoreductase [Kordiimonadaceae bacterium]MBT7582291.1 NAD(P)-dependent oxidoreductase [Kordiimonadaceae bacterium]
MSTLKGKTVFVTGGSRGIGLAIALRCAADGANVTIAAKTVEPHPKLEGTIYTALDQIERAGGKGLACQVDIRDEELVAAAVEKTVSTFGGIDILINNASAISLTPTVHTEMKRYDLMHNINTRGTFMVSKACIPHLLKAENPQVLNISPPLNMEPKWFGPHVAYTMAKFGMSMCVLGMAEEFKKEGIAFNALWPRTVIATAAVRNLLGGEQAIKGSRKPEIMADAAHIIFNQNARENSGNFYVDDEVMAAAGITDLGKYAVDPDATLLPDFFVDPI